MERPKEVGLYRPFLHPGYFSDFEKVHIFYEPKEKYRTLPRGQTRGGSPDCPYLFLDQGQRFRGLLPVRKGASDIANVCTSVQRSPPELQAAVGLVVSHQIGRDLHEPRSNAGSAAKLVARLIGLYKTVLRQILGGFSVPQRSQDKPEDSRPMKPNQRIEFFQRIGAAFAG